MEIENRQILLYKTIRLVNRQRKGLGMMSDS